MTRPLILLVAASVGIAAFARGVRLADTLAMLVCGAIAGGALASIAARRGRS